MNENMEKIIKFFTENPVTSRKERSVLLVNGRKEQIYERSQETRLTEGGMPLTLEENSFMQLDDGTSMADAAECQNCGRRVRIKSLRRCPCGITCCVYCRKVWRDPHDKGKAMNYCSVRHVFLHRLGLLQRF